ncbi:MAG: alpha-L-rhamnosidase C-terminal domain-containing protein [Bryobacterales bacterium]|nr:alpha-L-rhamnosidase C-terminal domain-containing protein [Bryobacterales bacterium]
MAKQPAYDDSMWQAPQLLTNASPRDSRDAPNRWMLVPREIPLMEEKPIRIPHLRMVEGPQPPGSFPLRPVPHPVQANRKSRLILDQGELTTGYPEILVSGGRAATIVLRYAEALYEKSSSPGRPSKGDRDEVEGKNFVGYGDVFHLDGGASRVLRPLWWRTWRYIELSIETKDDSLIVEDISATYTGYPFERKSSLHTSSPQANEELQTILDVGWRTARLCAHETYMDCPYYEQLQYGGDTRIQALVSLYTSGDARLMKQAIDAMDATRSAEGLTYSRAPSELQQYIPPFSLWWIGMLHDYWMHVEDAAYVKSHIKGVRAILRFYEERQEPTGSLGKLPWWNFVDWAWEGGVPPNGGTGNSASLDLQLLLALDWAAEIEDTLGSKAMAAEYRDRAATLRSAIRALYWDGARGLFADTPAKNSFSQQANSMAILAGLAEGEQAGRLFDALWAEEGLTKSTVYFRFYTHAAARAAGRGDRFLSFLDLWRDMLRVGLSTWAEMPEPSRSDCHAWGSSPNFELFRTMLGVSSAAPGFRKVRVAPHLGPLGDLEGSLPHPRGEVRVSLKKQGAGLAASVDLPQGVDGVFVWKGKERALRGGGNTVHLP